MIELAFSLISYLNSKLKASRIFNFLDENITKHEPSGLYNTFLRFCNDVEYSSVIELDYIE